MKKHLLIFIFTLLNLFSSNISYSQNITTGLVGYWKFENNMNDETSNGNNAVIHGGVIYVPHVNSCGNFALSFDGSGDYLTIANNSAYAFGLGAFTIAMEINYSLPQPFWAPNGYASITDKLDAGCPGPYNGLNMFVDYDPPGNSGIAQGRTLAFNKLNTLPNIYLRDGAWHCLVFTREPDLNGTCTLKLYIDGLLNNSATLVQLNNVTNSSTLYIGANSCNSSVQNYLGQLDNYRLYNRALTLADVQMLCNCASAPTVALSSSDSSFCEKQCIDFYDLSSNSPTSWQWHFPGAQPDTSTLQNPTNICYNNYGNYDVTLIACNNSGCDTLTFTNFINEYQNPVDSIYLSNDTLFSLPAYSYQWYEVTGGMITGETNQFYHFQQPGSYYCVVSDSIGCVATSNIVVVTSNFLFPTSNFGISISPNPVSDLMQIHFQSSLTDDVEIEISNVIGEKILNEKFSLIKDSKNISINISGFKDGIYFLSIHYKQFLIHEKFVVKK